jgi:drug/metabolite transporter (DMT)-like permease
MRGDVTARAVLLVLLSAFLHALWNAVVKSDANPRSAGLAVLAVATAVAGVLAPFSPRVGFPTCASLQWGLAAGFFEGTYFTALGLALARGSLGPVYTVARGGAMLVTWPLSVVLLGEPFSCSAWVGAITIAVGLGLTTVQPRQRSPAGMGWAAVSAVSIGGYHLCYKVALTTGAEPRALFAVALACALPVSLASMGRRTWRGAVLALQSHPLRIVAGGATCTASFVLLLQALAVTGAGAVLTLRNTSVLFAQLIAILVGERPSRRALGGALLVVVGAVLLVH